jgi:hypothetical protein
MSTTLSEPRKRVKRQKSNENREPQIDPKEKFKHLMNCIDHERGINNPFIKIKDENPSRVGIGSSLGSKKQSYSNSLL